MDIQQLVRELKTPNKSKIVMLVADGLGGLPIEPGGPTELEAAKTPNLDALAKHGVQGSLYPVAPAITPGSGPGHLGLFGYDPVKHLIGRGVLEATGVVWGWAEGRGGSRNFCTLDANNISTAAGRIPSEESALAVSPVKIPGVGCSSSRSRHRRIAFRRGPRPVADTDPQRTGVPPLTPIAHDVPAIARPRWPKAYRPGSKAVGRPAEGQRTDDASFSAAVIASYEEVYGLKAGHCRVSDVQAGPTGRHGGGWRATARFRRDRRWNRRNITTSSSFTSSTPTAGARTATSTRGADDRTFDAIVPRVVALKPMVLIVTATTARPPDWPATVASGAHAVGL